MRALLIATLAAGLACGGSRPRVEVSRQLQAEVQVMSAAVCDCVTIVCVLDVHVRYRELFDQLAADPDVQRDESIRDNLAMHALCLQHVRAGSLRQRELDQESSSRHCLATPRCDRHAFVRGRERTTKTFIEDMRALAEAMCECTNAACAGEVGEYLRATVTLHEDDDVLPADMTAIGPALRDYRRCVAPLCEGPETTCTDDTARLLP